MASFIDRVHPARARTREIEWPFALEDGAMRPKVRMRVLPIGELEAAHIEVADHFEALKKNKKAQKGSADNTLFLHRERCAIVWRAFTEIKEDGSTTPLASSVDELAKTFPEEFTSGLYFEWAPFQQSIGLRGKNAPKFDDMVEELKKNFQATALLELPSSWLIGLISTLVAQSLSSTKANEPGSSLCTTAEKSLNETSATDSSTTPSTPLPM